MAPFSTQPWRKRNAQDLHVVPVFTFHSGFTCLEGHDLKIWIPSFKQYCRCSGGLVTQRSEGWLWREDTHKIWDTYILIDWKWQKSFKNSQQRSFPCHSLLLMEEIRLTSWYGKYPIIYRVSKTSQVVVWNFWTINSIKLENQSKAFRNFQGFLCSGSAANFKQQLFRITPLDTLKFWKSSYI